MVRHAAEAQADGSQTIGYPETSARGAGSVAIGEHSAQRRATGPHTAANILDRQAVKDRQAVYRTPLEVRFITDRPTANTAIITRTQAAQRAL